MPHSRDSRHGNIIEKNARKTPEVPQTARDIEAHTGQQSLEQIAKKETALVLQTAVSWEDLHKRLAEHGFVLARKGNGAVLNCGGTFVKISKISRECSFSSRRGAGSSVLYCRGGAQMADFSDMGKRIVLGKKKLDETSVAAALQLANQKWGATRIAGSDEYKELCVSVAVKHDLKLANPDLAAEVERRRTSLRHGGGGEIAEAEIAALRLVENPRIYTNPRTDNQQYRGRIVHVDKERGYCVQLVGKRSLFVHRFDKLEVKPTFGEEVRIAYNLGEDKAKVQRQEVRREARSL